MIPQPYDGKFNVGHGIRRDDQHSRFVVYNIGDARQRWQTRCHQTRVALTVGPCRATRVSFLSTHTRIFRRHSCKKIVSPRLHEPSPQTRCPATFAPIPHDRRIVTVALAEGPNPAASCLDGASHRHRLRRHSRPRGSTGFHRPSYAGPDLLPMFLQHA